jgi:hypothetical protein
MLDRRPHIPQDAYDGRGSQVYSFEAARVFIRATGADVICVSLLQTSNSDYEEMAQVRLQNGPYLPNQFTSVRKNKTHGHRANIIDPAAPSELRSKLREYRHWD